MFSWSFRSNPARCPCFIILKYCDEIKTHDVVVLGSGISPFVCRRYCRKCALLGLDSTISDPNNFQADNLDPNFQTNCTTTNNETNVSASVIVKAYNIQTNDFTTYADTNFSASNIGTADNTSTIICQAY